MSLGVNNLCTVWEIKKTDKGITLQVSSAKKDKSTGAFVKDFSGFLRCYADAKEKAEQLERGDTIKVLSFNVTTNSVKNGNQWTNYTNFNLFDFEITSDKSGNKVNIGKPDNDFVSIPDNVDDELPFN